MTAQAALWNWGKSGKLGIIFFMDLGMWGFRARASVFSGQMATVLASVLASLRPHPSPTSSPPRACAHVPARPLRCPDWAAWGGGPCSHWWEAQGRGPGRPPKTGSRLGLRPRLARPTTQSCLPLRGHG